MSTGKKVFNVFGIIFAWILSIALILILMVSPLFFSAISLVQPESLVDAVTSLDVPQVIAGISGEEEEEASNPQVQQLEMLLNTNAAKELLELYAVDVANALYGRSGEVNFTSEKFVEIVDKNIDELVDVFKTAYPETAQMPVEEMKSGVRELLTENAEEVVAALPAPDTLKTQLIGNSPEMKAALAVLGQLDTIMWSFIGVVVLLSILIFVCRLFGFRGFRWLAVDLFVASAFSGLMCVPMITAPALLSGLTEGNAMLSGIMGTVASDFAVGMLIRTVVMFVFGVALLVGYIFIKKSIKMKKTVVAVEAPLMAEKPVDEVNPITEETPVSEEK